MKKIYTVKNIQLYKSVIFLIEIKNSFKVLI
jgi:hypothetical protein